MRYINSTPINVMLTETGIVKIEERAKLLAYNFWVKTLMYRHEDLNKKMTELFNMNIVSRDRYSRMGNNLLSETWREIYSYRNEIEKSGGFEIYKDKYWSYVKKIKVEKEIGEYRKEIDMEDAELLEDFRKKYDLREDMLVIFIDGSKQIKNKSVGLSVIIEGSEIAYTISINNKCSVYTAEALAIKKALDYVQEYGLQKDVLILTDAKSVCQAIESFKNKAFQNNSIFSIKKRITELEKISEFGSRIDRKVVIGWIPGHSNIKGNDEADRLAKEATKEESDNRIKVLVMIGFHSSRKKLVKDH